MAAISKQRPTAVTVIGWVYISLSIFMILVSFMCILMSVLMQNLAGKQDLPIMLERFMTVYQIGAFIEIIVGVFVLYTSIQFLKLKSWTRAILEVFSRISLSFTVLFSIFFVLCVIVMMQKTTPNPEVPRGFLIIIFTFGSIINCFVWGIPNFIIIKHLRKPEIKQIFGPES